MNKTNLILTGMIFLVMTLGCSTMMKGTKLADPAVAKFHQQFNDKQFAQIYAESSRQFKDAVTEKEWVDLLEKVYGKLGAFKKTESTNFSVNTTNEGDVLKVNYNTEFAGAKGTEEFTFLVDGDKVSLFHYGVESDALKAK
jgi:hypothetical protein